MEHMPNYGHIMWFAECFLDLSFAVDSSGSINYKDPTNWDKSLQFVANITNSFDIGPDDTQVAFVVFSTTAEVEWDLTRYRDKTSLLGAIEDVPYLGDHTNLNDALYLTRTQVFAENRGTRPGAIKATIILTDGEDNIPAIGTMLTIANATALENEDVRLIAVGVSNMVDEDRLLQIVSSPDDLYRVDDFGALSSIVAKITPELCDTPAPQSGTRPHFTCYSSTHIGGFPALGMPIKFPQNDYVIQSFSY